jgi:hypothetical protein
LVTAISKYLETEFNPQFWRNGFLVFFLLLPRAELRPCCGRVWDPKVGWRSWTRCLASLHLEFKSRCCCSITAPWLPSQHLDLFFCSFLLFFKIFWYTSTYFRSEKFNLTPGSSFSLNKLS